MWGLVLLEVEHPCFKNFPDECIACPEYRETKKDQASPLIFFPGMTYVPDMPRIVKECKRYNKRKVEYLT
jgi:hypothetical protein